MEPVVFPFLQSLPSAIFQQDNARPHVPRNVQEFFTNPTELIPCSPDLSKTCGPCLHNDVMKGMKTSSTFSPDEDSTKESLFLINTLFVTFSAPR
ncbi:hypothetical protein TNCV_4568311 [Trichonephila clavipes]|nr:hypothetical protein TNCV_4568311 [Trichonephila clavipes]